MEPADGVPEKKVYYALGRRPSQYMAIAIASMAAGVMMLSSVMMRSPAAGSYEEHAIKGDELIECPYCGSDVLVQRKHVKAGHLPCPNCGRILFLEVTDSPVERAIKLPRVTRKMTIADVVLHSIGLLAILPIMLIFIPRVLPNYYSKLVAVGTFSGFGVLLSFCLLVAFILGIVGAVKTFRGSENGLPWVLGASFMVLVAAVASLTIPAKLELLRHCIPDTPKQPLWGLLLTSLLFGRFMMSVLHIVTMAHWIRRRRREFEGADGVEGTDYVD